MYVLYVRVHWIVLIYMYLLSVRTDMHFSVGLFCQVYVLDYFLFFYVCFYQFTFSFA